MAHAPRRSVRSFWAGRHFEDEAPANAWSNAAYLAAAAPFVAVGTPTALCAAAGLAALGLGSWAYHARANRATLLADHVGMHLAVGGVAAFAFDEVWGGGPALFAAWALSSFAVLELWRGRDATTAVSRGLIKAQGAVLAAALFSWDPRLAAGVAALMAAGFATHDDGHDTPTGYGPGHSLWHLFTGAALALPAVRALVALI